MYSHKYHDMSPKLLKEHELKMAKPISKAPSAKFNVHKAPETSMFTKTSLYKGK